MEAASEINPRKSTIFYCYIAGLAVLATFGWWARILTDGAYLEGYLNVLFIVIPSSVVFCGLIIWSVVRLPGQISSNDKNGWRNIEAAFILAVIGGICVYANILYLNMRLDRTPTGNHRVTEINYYESSRRGGTAYFVTVVDRDDSQSRQADYKVSQDFYKTVVEHQEFEATYHPGAFGIPWISDLKSVGSPSPTRAQ